VRGATRIATVAGLLPVRSPTTRLFSATRIPATNDPVELLDQTRKELL
jgi:hypothetical protein